MSKTSIIDMSIKRRQITLKREWYKGICFGFVIQNDPRDINIIFILPFIALELEIEKSPSNGRYL
jgi:hypothetical protein